MVLPKRVLDWKAFGFAASVAGAAGAVPNRLAAGAGAGAGVAEDSFFSSAVFDWPKAGVEEPKRVEVDSAGAAVLPKRDDVAEDG